MAPLHFRRMSWRQAEARGCRCLPDLDASGQAIARRGSGITCHRWSHIFLRELEQPPRFLGLRVGQHLVANLVVRVGLQGNGRRRRIKDELRSLAG